MKTLSFSRDLYDSFYDFGMQTGQYLTIVTDSNDDRQVSLTSTTPSVRELTKTISKIRTAIFNNKYVLENKDNYEILILHNNIESLNKLVKLHNHEIKKSIYDWTVSRSGKVAFTGTRSTIRKIPAQVFIQHYIDSLGLPTLAEICATKKTTPR